MHRAARLSAILERLADGGSVTVADLVDDLDTSAGTIRRDLVILEQQRLLARTHGGATAHAVSYELPLRYKGVRYAEEKRCIARQAAAQVSEGMAVGLTGDDRHRGREGARRPAEAHHRDQCPEHRLRTGD